MEQLEFFNESRKRRRIRQPKEWKVVALRECPLPYNQQICDSPEQIAYYWRTHIAGHPHFNPECETFVVIHLNTRRHVRGHHLVGIGLLDSVLVHPREVFRPAIVAAAHAIAVAHNHPAGDPSPSTADIRTTRDLIRAGQLLRIEVLDHVIIGTRAPDRARDFCSLKELGQFYGP